MKKNFLLLLLLCLFITNIKAQETSPLLFVPGVPQSSFENPAYQNLTGKLAVGIPVLSGIYANWNSNITFNSLFTDGLAYSFNNLYNALDENGNAQSGVQVMMFFASVKHKKNTYSLSVSERATSGGNIDRALVRMVGDGIIGMYGKSERIGPSSFRFWHYKELGFGIAREITKGFDFGVRAKILFGKYYINTGNFHVGVETDTDMGELHIQPMGSYQMSGPLLYDDNFKSNIFHGDYFFQLRNLGLALDAGAVIRKSSRSEFSFAIADAGFIGFGRNIFNMQVDRPMRFSVDELFQSNDPDRAKYIEPTDALSNFGDSVAYLLTVESTDSKILTVLPAKLNIAAKYELTKMLSVGASNQISFYRHQPVNLLSVYLHSNVTERFGFAGAFSLYNFWEILPGIAAHYNFNRAQFYFASNNILGIIQPASSKHLNLCVGINFLFDTQ